MTLGALAFMLLAGCGEGNSPALVATTEAENISSSTTEVDEGWFVRTIASLGDERGLCIDLPGWTPSNIDFDSPVHSRTWRQDRSFSPASQSSASVFPTNPTGMPEETTSG